MPDKPGRAGEGITASKNVSNGVEDQPCFRWQEGCENTLMADSIFN